MNTINFSQFSLFAVLGFIATGCLQGQNQEFFEPAVLSGDLSITDAYASCAQSNGGLTCSTAGIGFSPKFNPFLAGMPDGTRSIGTNGVEADVADAKLAVYVGTPFVRSGYVMEFSATGATNNGPSPGVTAPDGSATRLFNRASVFPTPQTSENNISFLTAPSNSLIAVFLGPKSPTEVLPPAIIDSDCPQDYSSEASRNRLIYQPKLQQVFYIGDGKTAGGATQQFVVPAGATRLYFANMDAYEWSNNYGNFNIQLKSYNVGH